MKRLILLSAVFLLAFAPVQWVFVAGGELVDAVTLADGGSVVTSMSNGTLQVAYMDVGGATVREESVLPGTRPTQVRVRYCGRYVQVFVEFADGSIWRYTWDAPVDLSELCGREGVYMPRMAVYAPMMIK